jgi:hypothetical protein
MMTDPVHCLCVGSRQCPACVKATKPTVKVPSGTVEATHTHPQYGACVIYSDVLSGIGIVQIHANSGTAAVPYSSLTEIKR